MPAATNTGEQKQKFERTYRKYQPNAAQGPATEVLATVLNPVP